MLHSCLLICPYLYFLWHYQTSTVKTQHLAKYNDLAKNLYWLTHRLFQWTGRKMSISGEIVNLTQRFHPTRVYSVFFKDSGKISARSDQYPETSWFTLWCCDTLTDSDMGGGDREATAPRVCFCAKKRERGWKRQTTQREKKNCSLKSPTTLDKVVFIHEIGLYNMKPWVAVS